jgi:hypothetical protein
MDHARISREQRQQLARLMVRSRARTPANEDTGASAQLAQLAELAWACSATQPEMAECALALLSSDGEPSIRSAAARGLQHLLSTLQGLSRTKVLTSWASSMYATRREAAARALDSELDVLGATTALDCLMNDECSHVRVAANAAATRRRGVFV